MNKRLWLRNLAILSIPLVLGLVLLRIKLVRDRANVPMQNIVIPRKYRLANAIESVAFSPDCQSLAIADTDRFLQIRTIDKSKPKQKFRHLFESNVLVWRADNRLISGGSHSFQVTSIESESLEIEAPTDWKKRPYQYQKDHYAQCVISPKGTLAALGQIHGAVSVWNTQTGKQLCAFKAPDRETCGLALSADDRTLAVASLLTEKDSRNPKSNYVEQVGIEVALRDARTGVLQKTLRWDTAGINKVIWFAGNLGDMGLAFSPDGKLIAGAATAGLSVWNIENSQLVYERKDESVPRHGGQKWIAFSPDNSLIAAIGFGKKIYVWAAKTGKLLQEFNGTQPIRTMAFSPNGKLLATDGQDNRGQAVVKIWDVANMN